MLQRYNSNTPVCDLVFKTTLFWVQVHDIPVHFMTRAVAKEICDTIGEVQKSTREVDKEGGHFIKVRVLIDISLPLCRGRLITVDSEGRIWVSFKYERLPNVCFWCGRLNHSDKKYELWIESKGTLTPEQQLFNSTLKATPYTSTGRMLFLFQAITSKRNPKFMLRFKSSILN